ncbi:MAG: metallophosphoesterase [Weeksellaceae bacterium]
MYRWIILFIVVGIVEFYAWQAFKVGFDNKWVQRGYLTISLFVIVFIVMIMTNFDRKTGQTQMTLLALGLLLLVYIPKLLVMVFLITEDILRLFVGTYQHFSNSETSSHFLPERRKFVSQFALAIAAIPFASIIYGVIKGRYNYKVMKSTVYYDDLPDEFDGFKILQLSDLHVGSFNNSEKIQYGIDLINEQDFDLLVFTGDIVNSLANEMDDWYEMFSLIKKPEFGKFSILGNHDYGEYVEFSSPQEKEKNFIAIKEIHPKVGFDLLLNESRKIKKGNAEIALIGVENWGRNFKKAGDLKLASHGIKKEDFKILMTHDPSHWELEVQNDPLNYQLTLAGHTHGSQFGIEIPGYFKWSPVQYVNKYWAGMYQKASRYLYVNRGFGYHAYPGRVGIWPEITVLELKKKSTS